jgi:hypothetical protein
VNRSELIFRDHCCKIATNNHGHWCNRDYANDPVVGEMAMFQQQSGISDVIKEASEFWLHHRAILIDSVTKSNCFEGI